MKSKYIVKLENTRTKEPLELGKMGYSKREIYDYYENKVTSEWKVKAVELA